MSLRARLNCAARKLQRFDNASQPELFPPFAMLGNEAKSKAHEGGTYP